jgi:hypothetical protein
VRVCEKDGISEAKTVSHNGVGVTTVLASEMPHHSQHPRPASPFGSLPMSVTAASRGCRAIQLLSGADAARTAPPEPSTIGGAARLES